jgi:ubiquinone/menaquinone biosynthesis C-methylase UbiE
MSASRFDRTADRYAAAARARDWSGLIAWCEPEPGDRALDVAGGTGALAEALQGRIAEMTVADVSEPMLANVPVWAQRVVARAEQLPFADASFDLITCVRALHHIQSPTRALDEMVRLTAPGGRIVVEDFLADPDRASARRWERIERLRDPGHQRMLEPGEARSRLLAAGFTVDAEESWVETIDTAHWIDVAGCDHPLAAGIREAVGSPEFQITVGRARFRRPGA